MKNLPNLSNTQLNNNQSFNDQSQNRGTPSQKINSNQISKGVSELNISDNLTGFSSAQPYLGQTGGLGAKERETLERQELVALEEIRKELELAPEVKEIGVEVRKEEIELPPPLKKLGVEAIGPEQPFEEKQPISLPLTDEKIINNLAGPIWAALTWLAQWCLRQLKKVHIKLKKVHGQIIRVITK